MLLFAARWFCIIIVVVVFVINNIRTILQKNEADSLKEKLLYNLC
jgi:hypothetical protein